MLGRAIRREVIRSICVVPLLPDIGMRASAQSQIQKVRSEHERSLSASEVAAVLTEDLAQRQYFVTAALTKDVFASNAVFRDPTNVTQGVEQYLKALDVLFDPTSSSVQLVRGVDVVDEETLEADVVLSGKLKFPWKPTISPTNVHVVYKLDAQTGLVVEQNETWDKSATIALLESFFPSFR